ncbi:MAG TPA: hypothetical protein PKA64_09160 [Myxococcota bacterium]|nr:hypothetical protein [Myxococcota bacterium]
MSTSPSTPSGPTRRASAPGRPRACWQTAPDALKSQAIAAWLFLLINRWLACELGAFEIITRVGVP